MADYTVSIPSAIVTKIGATNLKNRVKELIKDLYVAAKIDDTSTERNIIRDTAKTNAETEADNITIT
jgi:hypothetical protein